MIDNRYVCLFPQYSYCGNKSCSLSQYCSIFPVHKTTVKDSLIHTKKNRVSKTYLEKKNHQKKYTQLNLLFGDLAEKKKKYRKRYYLENREMILESKRKAPSYKLRKIQVCEYECAKCPFEDCNLPEYENRKEYMELYTKLFHEKILLKKAEYRASHRSYLSNSEKIRNYQKRGYMLRKANLIKSSCPEDALLVPSKGVLTIIKINGFDYYSYITLDRLHSLRSKVIEKKGDMNNLLLSKISFLDHRGYLITFELDPIEERN